jgi:hypothetical protein
MGAFFWQIITGANFQDDSPRPPTDFYAGNMFQEQTKKLWIRLANLDVFAPFMAGEWCIKPRSKHKPGHVSPLSWMT